MTDNNGLTGVTVINIVAYRHTPLPRMHGDQWEFRFSNGYGASVIRHDGSYGGKSGLFELAVLDAWNNVTTDTSVTGDVIGWLSVDAVKAHLLQIAALRPSVES